jgi:hypothetical protein
MKRIFINRLKWYLESYSFLSNIQVGFRKSRCVANHIIRQHDKINEALRDKQHALGTLTDLEKAFDSIWLNRLQIELRQLSINGKLFVGLKASTHIELSKFQVRVGHELFDAYSLVNAAAQYSIISPVPFIIMTNDTAKVFANAEISSDAEEIAFSEASKNVNLLNQDINTNLKKVYRLVRIRHWSLSDLKLTDGNHS